MKHWTVLYMESFCMSTYTGVINLQTLKNFVCCLCVCEGGYVTASVCLTGWFVRQQYNAKAMTTFISHKISKCYTWDENWRLVLMVIRMQMKFRNYFHFNIGNNCGHSCLWPATVPYRLGQKTRRPQLLACGDKKQGQLRNYMSVPQTDTHTHANVDSNQTHTISGKLRRTWNLYREARNWEIPADDNSWTLKVQEVDIARNLNANKHSDAMPAAIGFCF